MPLLQKPPSGATGSTGVVILPPTAQLVDPNQLSNSTLTGLGFDPNNLPNPFNYPDGMAISLVDVSGTPTLFPTDQSTNIDNFIGFLNGSTPSDSQSVAVLTIRGSQVNIFGEVGLNFSSGDTVFISEVAGRVTNVAVTNTGLTLIRVGFCFSNSEFILNTDPTAKIF